MILKYTSQWQIELYALRSGVSQGDITDALKLSADNPYAYVEAAGILGELRSRDEDEMAAIRAQQLDTARALDQMLKDKANRDSLFIEELGRAVAILARTNVKAEGDEPGFNGPSSALALAEVLVKDRTDEPAAYQLLGNRQNEAKQLKEASKTITAGLAIERLNNARQYVRDQQAKLSMQSQLADIKCTLALQSGEKDRRDALLNEAKALVNDLEGADTSQGQWRDARVDFLRGRIALAQRQPTRAVTFLEQANRAYGNKGRTLIVFRFTEGDKDRIRVSINNPIACGFNQLDCFDNDIVPAFCN